MKELFLSDFKKNRQLHMADAQEKLKALQITIDKLEKTYGKGTVMKLSDEKVMDVPTISTGSLSLDMALGVGGIPRGRNH